MTGIDYAAIPATVAAQVGDDHVMEWDPPAALTAFRRWTCTRCGDAVLSNGERTYGSATERTCQESRAFWGQP